MIGAKALMELRGTSEEQDNALTPASKATKQIDDNEMGGLKDPFEESLELSDFEGDVRDIDDEDVITDEEPENEDEESEEEGLFVKASPDSATTGSLAAPVASATPATHAPCPVITTRQLSKLAQHWKKDLLNLASDTGDSTLLNALYKLDDGVTIDSLDLVEEVHLQEIIEEFEGEH